MGRDNLKNALVINVVLGGLDQHASDSSAGDGGAVLGRVLAEVLAAPLSPAGALWI